MERCIETVQHAIIQDESDILASDDDKYALSKQAWAIKIVYSCLS